MADKNRSPAVVKCPDRDKHTEGPWVYTDWHPWALRMEKTHRQLACPSCHRYVIWEPK